ncbi:WecB/TagA/CpsF family glycosyltransferase [Rossellomorea sp. NPDC077527]|uniref:WecB/TagA/CpsF family glycosyltransferase n=1 Tax=Rossellomorea sp. NPDC077527 TaxID=3364510 RepID=UPI0037CC6307
MMNNYVNILGIPFIHTDQPSFVTTLTNHIEAKDKVFVITANPEIVMKAQEDESFMALTKEATYVTADGIGVVKAAQLLNEPLPGRVTGYDTMVGLLEKANERSYKIFLLGAKADTLTKACENINKDYPNIQIVGKQDGYFDWNQNDIAERIQSATPDMVFVALGVPRQEKWISENIDSFSSGVFMGVGGSFDVIAGTVERAPEIWQKMNMEWFYRLMKQPSRWRRMLALPKFALVIMKKKVTKS